MKNIIIFFLLLFNSSTLVAKNINSFKNFTIDNPLSSQSIRTIVQDKYGFMWFGSQEGLHRYDGYQFLDFHHDINDPKSLSSDIISRIIIDKQNNMWIATRGGGVNIYRESTNDFQRITTNSSLNLSNNDVNTLIEDQAGNIWIGTEKGVTIIFKENNIQDQSKWKVKHIIKETENIEGLPNNSVETILQTKNGNIWIGTSGGLAVFDPQGNFLNQIILKNKQQNNSVAKLIKTLYQDTQDNIWIGTSENGLFKTLKNNSKTEHYFFNKNKKTPLNSNSLSSNSIEYIYQDSTKRIWIGSDKGLMLYNNQNNNFTHINHSTTNQHSLTNDFILTVFEDKKNMLWIGTFSGISRWDPHMTIFKQYGDNGYSKLSSSLIMRFAQFNHNQVILATYANGLYLLNKSTEKISPFQPNVLPNNLRITTTLIDKNNLWIGTRTSGLFKISLKSNGLVHYLYNKDNKSTISANSITDIIKDKQGNVWVSTFHKGINKLNKNNTFTRFEQTIPLSNNGPSTNHILQLLTDNQGYIWLATYGGGINRLSPQTGEFIHIKHHENDNTSVSNDVAWTMLQDNKHNLWVGTQAAGINILSYENVKKNNFSFQHLNIKDGMKDQTVYGFSQDKVGNIWFSTNKGISRYSPLHKTFKHFDIRHGLIDMEYNHGAVFKDKDGIIYFGNAKGFTSVDPNEIINDQAAPKVRLTNIYKLNEAMDFKKNQNELTTLTLDHNDQLISFEYVGLNYSDPESTRYKYRLLGFDEHWVDAGKLRRATFTNLPAGKYQLEIIAGNNDNVWSDPGLTLSIIVKPAPWFTWWAYLLYTLLLALLLLAYSRFLNRKLVIEQQQKNHLKQQVQEKTQSFKQKNTELEQANKQLEEAATTDKLTGVNSRRYLDIYIEQASQLMMQIHQNIQPIQRSVLPRLYILMVKINSKVTITDSQLINLSEMLLYSRNQDDLVIRWSADTFAIIGYEKDDNVRELTQRIIVRLQESFKDTLETNMAYSFYPFNREQPMELSWDNISVMVERSLSLLDHTKTYQWLGLYQPKSQPFNYLDFLKINSIVELDELIKIKQG